MKKSLVGGLALVALSACGSTIDVTQPENDGLLATMGALGVPSPTLVGQNVMLVDATVNGRGGGRLLVDTGSPITIVNAASFEGAMVPAQTHVNVDIGIGALTIDAVPAFHAGGMAMDQLRLAGFLGGNVLRQFPTTFNYRDHELLLGAGATPVDVLPATKLAFKLSGGGTGTLNGSVVSFGATRIPVNAVIEGTTRTFVLDTGASDVTLRRAVFDALVADGRAFLADKPVTTVLGVENARVARCRSISVGGETVTNVPILSFSDTILDTISSELHYQVDGLLGGDFLREFLVTVDYPGAQVELARYASRDHIVDEFKRVGMWLGTSGAEGFVVSSVHGGSEVDSLGIHADDEVVSIDGESLAGLDLFAADGLLNGPVGGTHRIGFGRAHKPELTQRELEIPIEDLVPEPN